MRATLVDWVACRSGHDRHDCGASRTHSQTWLLPPRYRRLKERALALLAGRCDGGTVVSRTTSSANELSAVFSYGGAAFPPLRQFIGRTA
jgi:hypothetical protein